MPNHTLEEVALGVLQQRGMQPTPQNLNAIKAALENNPELLDNVQGSFRQQQRPGEQDRTESTNPIAFRDQFDTALEAAVNGGGALTDAQAAEQAGVSPPPVDINAGNQAAPPIGDVTQGVVVPPIQAAPPIPEPSSSLADIIGEGRELPPTFDAAAQDSASREFSGGDDRNGLLEAIIAAVAGAGAFGIGNKLLNNDADTPQRPAVGPADAVDQVPTPEKVKNITPAAPVARSTTRARPGSKGKKKSVAERVSDDVDAVDASEARRRVPSAAKTNNRRQTFKPKEFAGRQGVEFEVNGEKIITTGDGKFATSNAKDGADLFDIREPGLLERIQAFLKGNAKEFQAALRAIR